uniref:Uncharacterized protein n=1 Tax=Anolis carolinensis TaxID=28377 RepID=A0A803SNH4_ANOCA
HCVCVLSRVAKCMGRCLHCVWLFINLIFALNHVVAKSLFWYFVSQLKKMKESSGLFYFSSLFSALRGEALCLPSPNHSLSSQQFHSVRPMSSFPLVFFLH